MAEIHVNDTGARLILTLTDSGVAVDVSTASVKKFKICKPSGELLVVNCSNVTDGTNGQLKYDFVSGDLDEVGTYSVQAYIELSTWTGHSEIEWFDVSANVFDA